MLNLNQTKLHLSLLLLAGIAPGAFSAPRPNHALIDIACDAITMAKKDTDLAERIKPLVGKDTFDGNKVQIKKKLAKLQPSTLRSIRDALKPNHKRWLVAQSFHEFFNPTTENKSYGTLDYANILDELVKTSNRADSENVTFENNHKDFCSTFRQYADTNVLRLGLSLRSAYGKIKDDNTKALAKPILTQLKNNISQGKKVVEERIRNNKS